MKSSNCTLEEFISTETPSLSSSSSSLSSLSSSPHSLEGQLHDPQQQQHHLLIKEPAIGDDYFTESEHQHQQRHQRKQGILFIMISLFCFSLTCLNILQGFSSLLPSSFKNSTVKNTDTINFVILTLSMIAPFTLLSIFQWMALNSHLRNQ